MLHVVVVFCASNAVQEKNDRCRRSSLVVEYPGVLPLVVDDGEPVSVRLEVSARRYYPVQVSFAVVESFHRFSTPLDRPQHQKCEIGQDVSDDGLSVPRRQPEYRPKLFLGKSCLFYDGHVPERSPTRHHGSFDLCSPPKEVEDAAQCCPTRFALQKVFRPHFFLRQKVPSRCHDAYEHQKHDDFLTLGAFYRIDYRLHHVAKEQVMSTDNHARPPPPPPRQIPPERPWSTQQHESGSANQQGRDQPVVRGVRGIGPRRRCRRQHRQ